MKLFLLLFLISNIGYAKHYRSQEFKSLQSLVKEEGYSFKLKNYKEEFGKGLIEKDLPQAKWKSYSPRRVAEIPDSLDLRPQITPIENQGSLGSCWAFSLIANLADGLKILGAYPGRLSQEYLTQCSGYCNGGYFDAADELIKPLGAPLWDEVPYTARCTPRCKKGTPVGSITGWHFLGKNKSPSTYDIVAYMALTGLPVSITVAASGYWDNYSEGVFDGCSYGSTNHMINIVGYKLEGNKFDENGWLPPGKGQWILRNSWGTGWGEDGFMRSRITDGAGRRCNRAGERAAVFEYDIEPPPPVDPECGNGVVEKGEQCDDGNLEPGDGCDANCRFENECGNGKIEPPEECDPPGDKCDENCRIIPDPPPPSPSIWERIWRAIVAFFDWLWPFN